jgi:putative proteasome-type protease
MTYCLGIITEQGLVMASDSRTNAGYDQVNICRKMHLFVIPGERCFVVLTSGSLSISQSVMTLLRQDFDAGKGLATAETFYDATRVVGACVRTVAKYDREALEDDDFKFNINLVIGGQIRNQPHDLYMVYPQGNPLRATEESPFLQIGESKYGRPILDRGIQYRHTTLEQAAKFALISFDSTMRSNVTVGPPIDMILYNKDQLQINHYRKFKDKDGDLIAIHGQWEQSLRKAVIELPEIRFTDIDSKFP